MSIIDHEKVVALIALSSIVALKRPKKVINFDENGTEIFLLVVHLVNPQAVYMAKPNQVAFTTGETKQPRCRSY